MIERSRDRGSAPRATAQPGPRWRVILCGHVARRHGTRAAEPPAPDTAASAGPART